VVVHLRCRGDELARRPWSRICAVVHLRAAVVADLRVGRGRASAPP